jgi:hypothetical protein
MHVLFSSHIMHSSWYQVKARGPFDLFTRIWLASTTMPVREATVFCQSSTVACLLLKCELCLLVKD